MSIWRRVGRWARVLWAILDAGAESGSPVRLEDDVAALHRRVERLERERADDSA